MAIISIEGMEFFAYHGCFAEEQIIGTKFHVDLFLEVNTETAELTDQLSDTVNYQSVYQTIKVEMQIKSKLLEHLARRILVRIQSEFPSVENATIKVQKLNPPLGGKIDFVSVQLKMK
jgi:dihydroneopterin aldolase